MLSGCSSILGLRDIDEGARIDVDAGALRDRDAATTADVLVETPAPDAGDAAEAAPGDAGFCGAYPNAVVCDDFEGTTYSSKWRAIAQSGVIRDNHPGAGGALGDLVSNFDPIPPSGKAALAVDGLPGGTRSLRFSLWVPYDSYPGDSDAGGMRIAALVDDATGDALRVELLGLSPPELWVRDTREGGAPVKGIYIAYDKWYCISVQIDGSGTVTVFRDAMEFGGTATSATALGISTAEVGMTWTFGGNPGSVTLHYDDVVVAASKVACQ